jgi:hypothetical protein
MNSSQRLLYDELRERYPDESILQEASDLVYPVLFEYRGATIFEFALLYHGITGRLYPYDQIAFVTTLNIPFRASKRNPDDPGGPLQVVETEQPANPLEITVMGIVEEGAPPRSLTFPYAIQRPPMMLMTWLSNVIRLLARIWFSIRQSSQYGCSFSRFVKNILNLLILRFIPSEEQLTDLTFIHLDFIPEELIHVIKAVVPFIDQIYTMQTAQGTDPNTIVIDPLVLLNVVCGERADAKSPPPVRPFYQIGLEVMKLGYLLKSGQHPLWPLRILQGTVRIVLLRCAERTRAPLGILGYSLDALIHEYEHLMGYWILPQQTCCFAGSLVTAFPMRSRRRHEFRHLLDILYRVLLMPTLSPTTIYTIIRNDYAIELVSLLNLTGPEYGFRLLELFDSKLTEVTPIFQDLFVFKPDTGYALLVNGVYGPLLTHIQWHVSEAFPLETMLLYRKCPLYSLQSFGVMLGMLFDMCSIVHVIWEIAPIASTISYEIAEFYNRINAIAIKHTPESPFLEQVYHEERTGADYLLYIPGDLPPNVFPLVDPGAEYAAQFHVGEKFWYDHNGEAFPVVDIPFFVLFLLFVDFAGIDVFSSILTIENIGIAAGQGPMPDYIRWSYRFVLFQTAMSLFNPARRLANGELTRPRAFYEALSVGDGEEEIDGETFRRLIEARSEFEREVAEGEHGPVGGDTEPNPYASAGQRTRGNPTDVANLLRKNPNGAEEHSPHIARYFQLFLKEIDISEARLAALVPPFPDAT